MRLLTPLLTILAASLTSTLALPISPNAAPLTPRFYEPEAARSGIAYPEPERRTGKVETFAAQEKEKRFYEPEAARTGEVYPLPEIKTGRGAVA